MAETYSNYWYNPPSGRVHLGEEGNTTATPMSVTLAEDCFPRHIREDPDFFGRVVDGTRAHMCLASPVPANLQRSRQLTEDTINHATVGNNANNMALFVQLFNYVAEFIASTQKEPPDYIQLLDCEHSTLKKACKRSCGMEFAAMVIMSTSVGVYNHYAVDIQKLAMGSGTEIIATSYETGARSIIFELGRHMISTEARWGLLISGLNFMAFAIKDAVYQGDTYYHLMASPDLPYSPENPTEKAPSLISAMTAILRSCPYPQLKLRLTHIITPYTGSRSTRAARNPKATRKPTDSTGGERSGKIATKSTLPVAARNLRNRTILVPGKPPNDWPLYAILNHWTYETIVMRTSAQEVWDILKNPNIDHKLPYHNGDNNVTIHTNPTDMKSWRIDLYELLGSGIDSGVVGAVVVHSGGVEELVALKSMHGSFTSFYRELAVYEHLAGRPFVLGFYGGFAYSFAGDLNGYIILEELDKTFKVFDDMSQDEKDQAVACLQQLHEAGYHHGDIRAANFGVAHGRFVILDFGHSQPCDDASELEEELELMKTFSSWPATPIDWLGIEPVLEY